MELIEVVKIAMNGGAIFAVIYLAGQMKALKLAIDKLHPVVETKADKQVVSSLENKVGDLTKDFYKLQGAMEKGGK